MAPIYVQYGPGQCCPEGWINFDVTPTLRLQRLPLLGRLLVPQSERFPDDLRYGDIIKGLPIGGRTVDGIYASHVLEHLALDDFRVAIRNTFNLLKRAAYFV